MSTIANILCYRGELLHGTVLCVDPSVGSSSSMPGWAVYKQGKLVSSGILEVKAGHTLNQRLFAIARVFREKFETPDVLVIEHITQWGRRKVDSLLKGVGAVFAGVLPKVGTIEVPPSVWHLYPHPGYFKNDEQDAIAMGHFCLAVARGEWTSEKRERVPNADTKQRQRVIRAKHPRRVAEERPNAKASPTRRAPRSRVKVAKSRRVRRQLTNRRGEKSGRRHSR